MESRVDTTTEAHRQIFTIQEIFNVAHLMMYNEELLHGHSSALLNPRGGETWSA